MMLTRNRFAKVTVIMTPEQVEQLNLLAVNAPVTSHQILRYRISKNLRLPDEKLPRPQYKRGKSSKISLLVPRDTLYKSLKLRAEDFNLNPDQLATLLVWEEFQDNRPRKFTLIGFGHN